MGWAKRRELEPLSCGGIARRRSGGGGSGAIYTKEATCFLLTMVYTLIMKMITVTETYSNWFEKLRDSRAKAKILARVRRVELGNFGDCEPVGEGVSELRIHYGPGYRVYFVQRGYELVILLAGGDKSTQAKDIDIAKQLARDLKEVP